MGANGHTDPTPNSQAHRTRENRLALVKSNKMKETQK